MNSFYTRTEGPHRMTRDTGTVTTGTPPRPYNLHEGRTSLRGLCTYFPTLVKAKKVAV